HSGTTAMGSVPSVTPHGGNGNEHPGDEPNKQDGDIVTVDLTVAEVYAFLYPTRPLSLPARRWSSRNMFRPAKRALCRVRRGSGKRRSPRRRRHEAELIPRMKKRRLQATVRAASKKVDEMLRKST